MRKILIDSQIRYLIEKELNLPLPPAMAIKILNAVQKDDTAFSKLGEIISVDSVLTEKILKVANSPFYTKNNAITNIYQAMSMLGLNNIKNIALSFVIVAELRGKEQTGFDFDFFWRRSVTTAVSAELLAEALRHKDDDIFVTALLQDVGMLVIFLTKGEEYNRLLQDAQSSNVDLLDLEKDKYGFCHQQVGYALLKDWNIPNSISESILFHHQPINAPESRYKSTGTLYFADQLSALYTESGMAEKTRIFRQRLFERFGMDEMQTLNLLDDTAANSHEMLKAFELNPGNIRPYSLLLQEANTELEKLNLSNEQMLLEMKEAKELARELLDANIRLKKLVYRDGLTGLYNHRYFQESLTKELSRAARYHSSVSLIIFDIDFFKKVNDIHGHPAGDQVLVNISRVINGAVRPSDIVARYGGEEFAVILPETNTTGVKVFAARLRCCIEGIVTLVEGQLIYVTVSVGATTFCTEQCGVTKDILIKTADSALYQSKKNGRNQVTIFEPEKL